MLLIGLLFAGLGSPAAADDANWLVGHAIQIDAGASVASNQDRATDIDADRESEGKVAAEHHCMCVATIETPSSVQAAPAPNVTFLGWAGSALASLAAPPLAEPPSA
jgi:hypothetical protein